jgi:transcriptional regulator
MYVPIDFAPPEEAVHDLLANCGLADLITATPQGLIASALPLVYDRAGQRLRGHLARNNDHWRADILGEALVIVHGPDAYVSPAWYPSKHEHGRVVPTWNYLTAHVYGTLRVHDDPAWLAVQVRELTDLHESDQGEPWSVDDAPERFVTGQIRGIVGVEIEINRVQAKFKLSQNRQPVDIDGVIRGLNDTGRLAMATLVRSHRPTAEIPHLLT